ncbi:MAG: hypothetical protein HY690_14355 [Chloroflexi bacterium]|nr:hypothetical protein [Chloroflexota bacterium]
MALIDRDGFLAGGLAGLWAPQQLATALVDLPGQSSPAVWLSAATGLASDLVRRCGQLAATQPGVFFGLVATLALPGLLLPAYLLRTFLASDR